MKKSLLSFIPLLLTSQFVFADAELDRFKASLTKQLPGVEITRVSKSPLKGIYEVVSGPEVVYMTEDAQYMLDGDLVNLAKQKNLTEATKSEMRLDKVNALGEENMIIYTPDKVKDTVTIVTDVNCPYCRRLHSEMDLYMKYGIRVRYIFMPLKGKEDFDTTVSIWCSDDRNRALDMVKGGDTIEQKSCDNPIKKHLTTAREMGVRGTPAIILEDGTMLPGYVPIRQLAFEIRKDR